MLCSVFPSGLRMAVLSNPHLKPLWLRLTRWPALPLKPSRAFCPGPVMLTVSVGAPRGDGAGDVRRHLVEGEHHLALGRVTGVHEHGVRAAHGQRLRVDEQRLAAVPHQPLPLGLEDVVSTDPQRGPCSLMATRWPSLPSKVS